MSTVNSTEDEIDMSEQIVTDQVTASDQVVTSKDKSKRQRRRPRYQTDNLLREKSPTLTRSGTDNNDSVLADVTSTNQGKRTVVCNICDKMMTESRLANHIRLLHSTDIEAKDHRCEYCGKSYAIKYTYEQHVRTHKEGRPKCPDCGSTFASPFSLFRHRAKVHDIDHGYKTYNCDLCEKKFFSVSELTLHKQRHSVEKIHKCIECDKAFTVKGNLRMHMRTHAKEKLYKCDMCDSTFSHPYSLVSHRRIHTNEFPYSCEQCGKHYRSRHQLTSHKIVHTDKRPYQCDECPKTFRSRTAFKMHQDYHKGIKRFTCKFCERKFQCHANKLKHERRHVGEKKHRCQDCDKAFIEKQELKNHMKVHEKVVGFPPVRRPRMKKTPKRGNKDSTPVET